MFARAPRQGAPLGPEWHVAVLDANAHAALPALGLASFEVSARAAFKRVANLHHCIAKRSLAHRWGLCQAMSL